MGWSITIGNAEITGDADDDVYGVGVEGIWDNDTYLDEIGVPMWESCERNNCRCPSYSGWRDFVGRVGLDRAMYEAEGVRRLTKDHVKDLVVAVSRFKEKHPTADAMIRTEGTSIHYDMLRLEWLLWWAEWAVTNCERPALDMG